MKFYTDATLKMLREAIAKGYKDAAKLKANPAFAPLCNNDDFKKLLAELEKAANPAPPPREP